MSNSQDRSKPDKINPSQSKSRQNEDSKIRPNANQLKFSDIPVNNEDSKSLETLFPPQQSSKISLVDLLAANNQFLFSLQLIPHLIL